ncbi:hypothetical protein Sjap_007615 [Stephania japonica]|uniref:J domain-containing protein n=1 Tax=Stephania japonica TaxID=461633 RepID=A0AAP0PDP9_9MAGN
MMDCNKEEANRAKVLAEKKMLGKDFLGARKVAIRAQQLYPDLDNISQMLSVCDVHCSAEKKVLGVEMNWYAILQIEQTADEALIKKQYRKLALLLHPDKNKFAGAEAAFKLIGEAQRVLSDPSKRSVFDMKYRAFARTAVSRPPQQPSRNAYVAPQFTTMNPHQRQQQQQQHQQQPQPPLQPQQQKEPMHPNGRQTFWTVCPFCNIRYQYYNDVMNRALRCQSCFKTFFAYDLDGQSVPPSSTQSQFSQEKVVFNRGGRENAPQAKTGNSSSSTGFQGNAKVTEPSKKPDGVSVGSKTNRDGGVRASWANGKDRNEGKSTKSRKRGRNEEESSESVDTEDSSESEDYENLDEVGPSARQDAGVNGERSTRRSSRRKQQVSYNENMSDDEDFVRPPKRQKDSGLSGVGEDLKRVPVNEETCGTNSFDGDNIPTVSIDEKEGRKRKGTICPEEKIPNIKETIEKHKQKGKEAVVDDGSEASEVSKSVSTESVPKVFEVPDPDFYVFDDDRKEDCFQPEQIWAIYDTIDGMPRFYALIKKVFSSSKFKVRIMWLEADPQRPVEIDWHEKELPIACGRYKYGTSLITEDHGMFSHLTPLKVVPKAKFYEIYPVKGEIWAIFKNWHINWSCNPDDHRNYEFEYVEVLSDYSDKASISVEYLVKIKGFVSLFRRKKEKGSFQIPPTELLRFSHRITFYRTTGSEREDIPEGYFELDPASLPEDFINCGDAEDLKDNVEIINGKIKDSCHESSDNGKPGFPDKCTNSCDINSSKNNAKSRRGSLRKSAGIRIADGQEEESATDNKGCDRPEPMRSTRRSASAQTHAACVTEDLSPPQTYKIPDPVFNDFEADRSPHRFKIDQVWALFSDLDRLPKCYAVISKIVKAPKLVLHITRLEFCPLPKTTTIQWFAKDMPVSCGKFRTASSMEVFNGAGSFSHIVTATSAGKKYEIYPGKGEVWALYKNFDSEWTCSDLKSCEYEMVEVLEVNDTGVKVLVLALVDSYETIFRPKKQGRSVVTEVIPRIDLLRFSHRVPAFRLGDALDGSLKGCWELDPKAIPASTFRPSR